ncbi:lysozyme [Bacteroides xylanisolvens]|jgi:hypothetical protein|uniref:glycoside hydrolase family protein n=1 Tax=Bacteroides xylanisolvens TaxID=371601 RepID=UPI001CDB55C6|nr:lysozyme [Bacteroides xylanisolvens]MCA4482070.1 lysozyme [Bacteroides xylanisolvens]
MIFRKILLSLFVTLSMAAHAQARLPTEKQPSASASIFELPPFERAICCIRFYEGLHRAKDYPYVGYGHKLRPGERYSSNMSANEAEQLLRKDLRELCAMFRSYGQDSLLLAALSYNIGPYKVTGYKGKYPKSSVLKKLEVGNRNIRDDYVNHCHWRGKRIPSIERRRYAELMLLFTP